MCENRHLLAELEGKENSLKRAQFTYRLPLFPDSGPLALNTLFGGLLNIWLLRCDLLFQVRREIERLSLTSLKRSGGVMGSTYLFWSPSWRRNFFFPSNLQWMKLLFSAMWPNDPGRLREGHSIHIKAAFGRTQVSDSDASSIDNFHLQKCSDFWVLSTYFWAIFSMGSEG